MPIASPAVHASHPAILQRLRRAEGHLRSVIVMMGEGRDCCALAQQLAAVEAAIGKAKRALIHDHIEHCLVGANESDQGTIASLRALARYL